MKPKVISVIGKKGSGKSEGLEKLISILSGRGLRLGVVKRLARDDIEIDQPGKDTFRYRAGGAEQVILAGRRRLSLFANLKEELPVAELLSHFEGFDLVFLEGHFGPGIPRIELQKNESGAWEELESLADRLEEGVA